MCERELEITDCELGLSSRGDFGHVSLLRPLGFAWLDTGTHDSLLGAGQGGFRFFFKKKRVEHRQGIENRLFWKKLAYRQQWITRTQTYRLRVSIEKKTGYGQYLLKVADGYQ